MNVPGPPLSKDVDHTLRGDFTQPITTSWKTWTELTPDFFDRWKGLCGDSLTGTPFLAPEFVSAALRHGIVEEPPLVFACEQGESLIGLGLFSSIGSSFKLPMPHLRAWQTPHTYSDGLLLRCSQELVVLDAFFENLTRGGHWHAVEFPRCPLRDDFTEIWMESAERRGVRTFEGTTWERAALDLNVPPANDMQSVSLQRARSLRRGWKSLERHGAVRFEIVRDLSRIPRCLEELLRLEDLGWKGELGTSLASQESHSRFFRDMILGMADRHCVAFSRLLVAERPVAGVAHLISGQVVSAFKLGWDPEFERGCPGFQIKSQLAAQAADAFPGMRLVDSCASPGSFIEKVWSGRRSFALKLFAISSLAKASASVVGGLRRLKRNANRLTSGWWPR